MEACVSGFAMGLGATESREEESVNSVYNTKSQSEVKAKSV